MINFQARQRTVSSAIILAFLMAGCGSGQNDVDQSASLTTDVAGVAAETPAGTAAATGDGDWSGTYAAQVTEGGSGEATITLDAQANLYRVSIGIANGTGCSGEVDGMARVSGNTLTMSAPIEDAPGESCRITFTRSGEVLRGATENCMNFHGMSCGFDGAYRRTSAPPSGSRAPASSSTNAALIIGAWNEHIDVCEGDTSLVFRADGTFFNGGTSGRWSLVGNTIDYTILMQDTMDEPRPVRNPRVIQFTLVTLDQNSLIFREADGNVVQFVRCPAY